MEWISISVLVIIGLILLIVELIFIPGTTVVGLLGVVFIIIGIYVGFASYGKVTGTYITLGTVSLIALSLYLGFRANAWEKFSLKSSLSSKVNEGVSDPIQVGQQGLAISILKPVGKAEIEGNQYEVTTIGDYIEAGASVRVIKVERNKIFVELI